MAKVIQSFRGFIEHRYYDEIFDALFAYVAKHPDRLDLTSHRVQQPDEAELVDMNVNRIDVLDTPSDEVFFDVIVTSEIIIAETVKRNRETDDAEQWFRCSCTANLSGSKMNHFTVQSISVYNRHAPSKTNILSDRLVPIIAKQHFDDVAEIFLREYYPEALATPIPIDVEEVVRRMGLNVEEARISQYSTLFGEMVFDDCTVEIWDDENRRHTPYEAKRGTILIDPNVYFMRNIGSAHNTIIHECIHWFKHRKYHWLQGLFRADAALIKCAVNEYANYQNQKIWTDWDWMEWHANGIAPKVLMPKVQTKIKIEELMAKHRPHYGVDRSGRLMLLEAVMVELAAFYNVSNIAAKIRMLDLGYKEAEGVSTYIDDHYISNYAFDTESKNADQVYPISIQDGFVLYLTNPGFKEALDSGRFIYVDARYVLNHPDYVQRLPGGGVAFTEYGRMHTDECCLRFDLVFNSKQTNLAEYHESVMFQNIALDYRRIPAFNHDDHNMKFFDANEARKKFYTELADEFHIATETRQNFAQLAWAHIDRNGINKSAFQTLTLLSGKTYDRIKTNTMPDKPDIETPMAIGLELGGLLGEELVERAGHKLTDILLHQAYRKLLNVFKGQSIFECNEALLALNLKPIREKEYRHIISKRK